jgi:hypothetical protein
MTSSISLFSDGENFMMLPNGRLAYKSEEKSYLGVLKNKLPFEDCLYFENYQPIISVECNRPKKRARKENIEFNEGDRCEMCNRRVNTLIFRSDNEGNKTAVCPECIKYSRILLILQKKNWFAMLTSIEEQKRSIKLKPIVCDKNTCLFSHMTAFRRTLICVSGHVPKVTFTTTGPFLSRPTTWSGNDMSAIRASYQRRKAYECAQECETDHFASETSTTIMNHLVTRASIESSFREDSNKFIKSLNKEGVQPKRWEDIHESSFDLCNAFAAIDLARKKVAFKLLSEWPDSWLQGNCEFHPEVSSIDMCTSALSVLRLSYELG